MIRYDLEACFGQKIHTDRIVVECEDSGVTFAVNLATMRRVSAWKRESQPYNIPEGTTAKLNVVRPDRTRCVTEATLEGSNTVVCPLDSVACSIPGICKATVSLYSPGGERLTTAPWFFEVTQKSGPDVEGGNVYVDTVANLIRQAEAAAERAEEAVASLTDFEEEEF